MKHLFLVIFSVLFLSSIANAQRSQEMQSKTVKTASEIRARNFIDKLSAQVELTDEQKELMEDLIRDYLEDSQSMIGNEEQASMLARLEARRDSKARKILKTEEAYQEYEKGIEDLKAQMGRGYGRK